jgi:CxxC-x17-CxxC domain-containing protein
MKSRLVGIDMTVYEDRTLVCSQCQAEFVFSKGEQEFYAERNLASLPKRCKACRDAKKNRQPRKDDGIYRSPAFEKSAPAHQKIRGKQNFRIRNNDYRSPGLNERRPQSDEYRSPAFRDIDVLKPEEEYRAPGFREYEAIDPKEEYRAPGFSELGNLNIREEYRAPGYQDMSTKYKDEKPMFSVVCSACGQEAMVPFFPDEDKPVFCKPCYAAERTRRRAEAEAADKSEAADRSEVDEVASAPDDAAHVDVDASLTTEIDEN